MCESENGMARQSSKKFERPPNFGGTTDEDVIEFIRRYEKVARYNGWSPKDHHENLEMYLRASVEKWWRCLDPPTTDWEDTTADVVTNGVTSSVTTKGSRSRLIEAFKQGNYAHFVENKLRGRQQQATESATDYAYDVIALCKALDPTMSEGTKVNFLMGGLNADLTEILYPRNVVTAEHFLREVKLLEEGQAIARTKREKVLALMGEDLGQEDEKETKDEEEIRLELERMDSAIAEKILQRNKMRLETTTEAVRDTPDKTMGVLTLLGGEKDLLVVALRVNGRPDVAATIDTGAVLNKLLS